MARPAFSEGKVRELVRRLAADPAALRGATLSGPMRKTVNRFYSGLRERGACGKIAVFGIFERQIYTETVPDRSRPTVQGIIRGRVDPSSVTSSDGWGGCNEPVDLGYGRFRVDRSNDELGNGAVHINGVEGFRGLARVRSAKCKGLPGRTFHLHLKEAEWRYNRRRADKCKTLLRYLRQGPLGRARPNRDRRPRDPGLRWPAVASAGDRESLVLG